MSCAFDKEKLTGYYDGELDAAEKGEVEGHIASCSECLRDLGEIKASATLVKELPRARAPRSVAEGVSREIAAAGRVHLFSRFRTGLLWATAAAAGILIVANVLFLPQVARESAAPVAAAPPPVKVARTPAPDLARKAEPAPAEKASGEKADRDDLVAQARRQLQEKDAVENKQKLEELAKLSERELQRHRAMDKGGLPAPRPPAAPPAPSSTPQAEAAPAAAPARPRDDAKLALEGAARKNLYREEQKEELATASYTVASRNGAVARNRVEQALKKVGAVVPRALEEERRAKSKAEAADPSLTVELTDLQLGDLKKELEKDWTLVLAEGNLEGDALRRAGETLDIIGDRTLRGGPAGAGKSLDVPSGAAAKPQAAAELKKAPSAPADPGAQDALVLKDGRRVAGRLEEETEKQVKLRQGAGILTFQRSDVAAVERGGEKKRVLLQFKELPAPPAKK